MNFPRKARLRRPTASQLLSAVLFAIFAGATVFWLSLDRTPPNWDDAWYLTNSLNVYDSLTQNGIPGYLSKLNSVFGFKAPLIAALPTPFYLLVGRRWHAAYLVNIVAMIVLFAALYRIARQYWSTRSGVFAIAITGTIPLLYGLERWYLVEYSLTALAVAMRLPFDLETTAHENDLSSLMDRLRQASFFIYEDGGETESIDLLSKQTGNFENVSFPAQ